MSCHLITTPTVQGVDSSTINRGMEHALKQRGYSVKVFDPLKDAN